MRAMMNMKKLDIAELSGAALVGARDERLPT
jgi:hypothetical protein